MKALRRWWCAVEPGLTIDRDNSIERWDARGEGRAWSISFEGFGLTAQIFIGRTPEADR
ncbi:hypothetical protein [uncultured Sphingomonas sp.]|uniref:hypothetical protein n=1 Tax=uncultured Sphingomonas sp. TaxID=158754 RepID=UPI0025E8A70F|nr:hypothetical protein [uncultured Sphingomonas sp.]